jgi:hypothetical protein
MADLKISALPASTTPLAGTEVLPIVQSSATKQVSIANLTAGRAISATSMQFGSGSVLSSYEEGTWTMGIAFGGGTTGITYTVNTGRYIKTGKSVTVIGLLLLSSKGSSTGAAALTGLPYAIGAGNNSQSAAAIRLANSTFAGQYQAVGSVGGTVVDFGADSELGVAASLTNANFANNSLIQISYTYFVD